MDRENIQIMLHKLAEKCKKHDCVLELLYACNEILYLTSIGDWCDGTPRFLLDDDMHTFIQDCILDEMEDEENEKC